MSIDQEVERALDCVEAAKDFANSKTTKRWKWTTHVWLEGGLITTFLSLFAILLLGGYWLDFQALAPIALTGSLVMGGAAGSLFFCIGSRLHKNAQALCIDNSALVKNSGNPFKGNSIETRVDIVKACEDVGLAPQLLARLKQTALDDAVPYGWWSHIQYSAKTEKTMQRENSAACYLHTAPVVQQNRAETDIAPVAFKNAPTVLKI